jgi:hypothetical protein
MATLYGKRWKIKHGPAAMGGNAELQDNEAATARPNPDKRVVGLFEIPPS